MGSFSELAMYKPSQRTSVPAFEFCAYAVLAQNSKAYTAAPAAGR